LLANIVQKTDMRQQMPNFYQLKAKIYSIAKKVEHFLAICCTIKSFAIHLHHKQ
jgi:hypothetical protein